MSIFLLKRTGQRPLQFEGQLIISTSSRQDGNGSLSKRWHDVDAYRSDAGKLVIRVHYKTTWKGEFDNHDALVISADRDQEGDEARKALGCIDPSENLVGFPPGDRFVESQKRIRDDLLRGFLQCVTEVLGRLEPENLD